MSYTHESEENDDMLFQKIEPIDNAADLAKRKRIRRLLESRLEHLALKRELEDYDGELEDKFDWGDA